MRGLLRLLLTGYVPMYRAFALIAGNTYSVANSSFASNP